MDMFLAFITFLFNQRTMVSEFYKCYFSQNISSLYRILWNIVDDSISITIYIYIYVCVYIYIL